MQRGQSKATILAFRPRTMPAAPKPHPHLADDAGKSIGSRGGEIGPPAAEPCGQMADPEMASDPDRPIAVPQMGEIVLFTGVHYSREYDSSSCDDVSLA